ncbi:hypothetical protein [Vibrio hippocampi]|uniref:SPOR domain-containing protein n=1 Tax=Vibrio hippocampi TaxID=654686 RepID=A0ABM8ZML3_9VIBR|nr:hypothetical protein [Vibrio hippocampi]CAH0529779.1 hypothetical protein VHP8226_03535 [Vibrio hippocampi]
MGLIINRSDKLIVLVFVFLLLPSMALACEIEKGDIVALYSPSCPINTASSRSAKPVFIQFKFSGKSLIRVAKELEYVHQRLNVGVAAQAVATQKVGKGYRLLLGPIQSKEVAHFTQGLKSLGYDSTLLRTVPQSRTADVLPSPPVAETSPPVITPPLPVTPPVDLEHTYVKVLGEIEGRKLLAMMDSDAKLIRTTYPNALSICTKLGKAVTIASQDEYVALLSSDQALFMLGEGIIIPFWLNETWVVTRLERQVQKLRATTRVHYGVVCSVAVQ